MGSLEVLANVEPGEWNKDVVKLDGCCFHSYEWSVFSSKSNDAIPLYFKLRNDSGELSALTFCLKKEKSLGGVSLFKILSFGSLPACKNKIILKEMVKEVISYCRENGIVILEMHSFGTPFGSEVLKVFGFSLERRCEFLIDISMTKEELWKKLHSMKRRNIRKAKKEKLNVVRTVENGQIIKCRTLALETQRRKAEKDISFPVAPERYYELLQEKVLNTGLGRLYLAYDGQEVVAAALFVGFNKKIYYLLGASTDKGLQKRGPDLIMWTSITDYQEEGYRAFNMGGVSEKELNGVPLEESGLYQFKKRFSGEVYPCHKGTITLQPTRFKLYGLFKYMKSRLSR